jgi:DNA-binding IclR family transcriptional regulator
VIDMAMLSLIRRLHLRDGVSIRGISEQTGLSRNTVRRYLARLHRRSNFGQILEHRMNF